MLKLDKVWVYYKKKAAVRDFSMQVEKGNLVTLLGSNGAGKSTLMNAVSGVKKIKKGEISFKNKRINGLKPAKIAAMGIIQVPEGRRLFPLLTVRENLKLGAFLQRDAELFQRNMAKVVEMFPILEDKMDTESRGLSGGQQQMVAIARGLMANPEILLLDEPSLGLSPLLRQQLATIIKDINQDGTTVVLVEQNARLGLLLASYGYVIENGRLRLEGNTETLIDNDDVKKAYLGI